MSKAAALAADDFKNEKVRGRIERVDSEKIVASFEMLDDFVDTPTITLVAPGRAVDLNWLTLSINGVDNTTLDRSPRMFGRVPERPSFRIDSIELFRNPAPRTMTALISGAGFDNVKQVLINGTDLGDPGAPHNPGPSRISPTLLRAVFDSAADERIHVTLVTDTGVTKSHSVPNLHEDHQRQGREQRSRKR